MSVEPKAENPMKAAISVSSLCRLLRMSRSQFNFHVKKGTFHVPLRLASNNRPYYTESMVEDVLQARETGVGVNGEIVIWYERRSQATKAEPKTSKPDHSGLLEGLGLLGLNSVTEDQVEEALALCFRKGTTGLDEVSVLRTIFRHLKRSGAG